MPEVQTGDRIADAFANHGKRAALMPYLMGGFPTLDASREIGLACADAGADLVELGVPFSDPLADGPVIHAAATEALRAGATPLWVLEVCAAVSERIPVVLMAYANIVLGHDGFLDKATAAGASGLIVPDVPHDEAADLRAECDARGLALVPHRRARTSGSPTSAATRAASSTRCPWPARPASVPSCRPSWPAPSSECARPRPCPLPWGSASPRPRTRAP
jgi:tryptophan synthase alpha subunit